MASTHRPIEDQFDPERVSAVAASSSSSSGITKIRARSIARLTTSARIVLARDLLRLRGAGRPERSRPIEDAQRLQPVARPRRDKGLGRGSSRRPSQSIRTISRALPVRLCLTTSRALTRNYTARSVGHSTPAPQNLIASELMSTHTSLRHKAHSTHLSPAYLAARLCRGLQQPPQRASDPARLQYDRRLFPPRAHSTFSTFSTALSHNV